MGRNAATPRRGRNPSNFSTTAPGMIAPGAFWPQDRPIRFADLFCGIGGFHLAAAAFGMRCVLACDIDAHARKAYQANFGLEPCADIRDLAADAVPDMDLLMGGFPCQPFSIIGGRAGFADARGTLFFEIARILEAKRPRAFLLENVRQLKSHQNGETLRCILEALRGLGYTVEWTVLNALDFGLPQKRERLLIVGFDGPVTGFEWPRLTAPMKPLSDLLETQVDARHYASDAIRRARQAAHTPSVTPSIWHENKSGSVSSHPYSCALRAGASHNYLLVNGERRLTAREMLRLQGFPDTFQVVCSDAQTRQQAGNSVPVPMIQAALGNLLKVQRAKEREA